MDIRSTAALPLHRFKEFGDLNPREVAAIVALGEEPRVFARHATIRREDVPVDGFFLLIEGWATASTTLPDGRRQILKVHLPGDVMGSPSMIATRTVEALTAITQATVAKVTFARFGALLEDHPRLGFQFFLSAQRERLALMDQLASMGRTTAEARLAALLIDLMERLEPLGMVRDGSFPLPLTQEQIGDTLGLTNVHVNRMLRELERTGLIERERHRLTLRDRAALTRLASRSSRTLVRDVSWLPASR